MFVIFFSLTSLVWFFFSSKKLNLKNLCCDKLKFVTETLMRHRGQAQREGNLLFTQAWGLPPWEGSEAFCDETSEEGRHLGPSASKSWFLSPCRLNLMYIEVLRVCNFCIPSFRVCKEWLIQIVFLTKKIIALIVQFQGSDIMWTVKGQKNWLRFSDNVIPQFASSTCSFTFTCC